jgi:hypothetical protein
MVIRSTIRVERRILVKALYADQKLQAADITAINFTSLISIIYKITLLQLLREFR